MNNNSLNPGANTPNLVNTIDKTLEEITRVLEPKEGRQFASASQVQGVAQIVERDILSNQSPEGIVAELSTKNSPYLPIVEITLDRRGILEQGGHLNDALAFHLAVEKALLASRGVPTEIFYGAISILESVRGVSTASVLPLLEVYYEQLAAQNLDGEFICKLLTAYRPNIKLKKSGVRMLINGNKRGHYYIPEIEPFVNNVNNRVAMQMLPPSAFERMIEHTIDNGGQLGLSAEYYEYIKEQVYSYFVLGGLTPANINKIKAKIINANSKLYGMQ